MDSHVQRQWKPMDNIGEFTDEQFVGNYMVDFDKTSPRSPCAWKNRRTLLKNAHYMDISEHRALLTDEHLSKICVSHIESSNLVYIMSEDDHERAMKLLEAMRSIDTTENHEPFRPVENRLCAVKNNSEWLRARCQLTSADKQIVKVRYVDWGNTVHMKSTDIRQLPKEFYEESACCLLCRLDGVDEMKLEDKILNYCNDILIGAHQGEFDLNLIVTKVGRIGDLPRVVLYRQSNNLNDEIYKCLPCKKTSTEEQQLVEQFTHELPLIVGEQYRALLSSFTGKDTSFYISVDYNNYNEIIEKVLNSMTDDYRSPIVLRPSTIVCVKYEGKYARAWVQAIDDDQYQVFYVDWGNESKVMRENIRACPESIRYIPWLANRVKFHNGQLTKEEFDEFWKTIENDYCHVFIIDQCDDHYSIEIKYDYLVMIRKRRAMSFLDNNL